MKRPRPKSFMSLFCLELHLCKSKLLGFLYLISPNQSNCACIFAPEALNHCNVHNTIKVQWHPMEVFLRCGWEKCFCCAGNLFSISLGSRLFWEKYSSVEAIFSQLSSIRPLLMPHPPPPWNFCLVERNILWKYSTRPHSLCNLLSASQANNTAGNTGY